MRSRVAKFALAVVLAWAGTAWAQTPLTVARVGGAGPIADPAAPIWTQVRPVHVVTLPQTVTLPHNDHPAIHEIMVRAVHNGGWIAFLIEWKDPTLSDRVVLDNFGDQVAVELPIDIQADPPSPMMGNPAGRVNIMQWRAAFQHDLQTGDPTIHDLYPNALIDTYPDQVLRATDARPYMGAVGLDNPISHARRSAVLDQMAEGWGSMTVKPVQDADGRGIWADGKWLVVISHPLWTGGDNDPDLRAGGTSAVAFAVWDGGNREVGSRKAWAPWVTLRLAP